MTSFEHILYEVDDSIALITLNRPDQKNSYIPELGDELIDAFHLAQADVDARAIVFTGAGSAFCAGLDRDYLAAFASGLEHSEDKPLSEEAFLTTFPLEIYESPKPVLAAINGHAMGIGISIMMACDIRIAADNAKIGFIFSKLGMTPGVGSTHVLPRLLGMSRAMELVLVGDPIGSVEAAEIGLISRSVPQEDVLKNTLELAKKMAQNRPEILAACKHTLRYGAEHSFAESMLKESETINQVRQRAK